MPYVTEEQRVPWETYAAANRQHNTAAYTSEEKSKADQDKLFGKERHEIDGIAKDFQETMEALADTFDTSKIWYVSEADNATKVSSSIISDPFFFAKLG